MWGSFHLRTHFMDGYPQDLWNDMISIGKSNCLLVGGWTNPSGKIWSSKWESFPSLGVNIKSMLENHRLVFLEILVSPKPWRVRVFFTFIISISHHWNKWEKKQKKTETQVRLITKTLGPRHLSTFSLPWWDDTSNQCFCERSTDLRLSRQTKSGRYSWEI